MRPNVLLKLAKKIAKRIMGRFSIKKGTSRKILSWNQRHEIPKGEIGTYLHISI